MQVVPGLGLLTANVWPVYLGATTGDPGTGWQPLHEPFEDLNYKRGDIFWRREHDDTINGSAKILIPKGVYTHLVFCAGPCAWGMMGSRKLQQPIVFDRPGILDIDPIRNQDYLPRQ